MNNDEKIFNLVEKMYLEFSGRFEKMDQRFGNLENDVAGLKKSVIHIENDHGAKLKAIFDGQKQTNDRLDRLETKVDTIFEQVGAHEVQLKLLKK